MRINPSLSRRAFLSLSAGAMGAAALPAKLWALTSAGAQQIVAALLDELLPVINSGRAEAQIYRDFERLLGRYADLPIVAQSVVGPDWRRFSRAQKRAFVEAFSGYIARKYGRRFRELIGSRFEVTGARELRNFVEVRSTARLSNQSPLEVIWLVSDRSGQTKIFNLIIEGINMRTTEAEEVGALLDQNGGNIDALIAAIRNAG